MTASSTRPVARLRGPAEILAALPTLCGFVPTESILLVSLRGKRRRIGLTARYDLPSAEAPVEEVADVFVGLLSSNQAREALLVVYTEEPGPLPRASLVEAVSVACASAGISVHDALLVRRDQWWSYRCTSPECCPPEGSPLLVEASPALTLLAAESAYDGRAVQGTRAELEASLAAPVLLARASSEQLCQAAETLWAQTVGRAGAQAARTQALGDWAAALRVCADGGDLDNAALAWLAVTAYDLPVRDEVLTWALDEGEALLALLTRIAVATAPPHDAAVCTLLGVTAWSRGDGAVANVALERALRTDPTYRLANLIGAALASACPPKEVRRWLRACARG